MVFKAALVFFIMVLVIILSAWLSRSRQEKAEKVGLQVIGMTEKRAKKHLRQNYLPYRVASRNNVDFFLMDNYKANRVNLYIRDRKVIDVEIG